MKINQKLLAGFVTVSILTLVISYFTGMAVQKKTIISFQEVGGEILPGNIALARMTSELYHVVVLASRFAEKKEARDKNEIEKALSTLSVYKTTYQLYQPEDTALYSRIDASIQSFSRYITEYILQIQKGGSEEDIYNLKHRIEGVLDDFISSVNPYIEDKFTKSFQKLKTTKQESINANKLLINSGVAILIIAFVLSYLISRLLSRPLLRFRDTALEISKGRLDIKLPVSSKDEIGELANAFNEMTGNLSNAHEKLIAAHQHLEREMSERLGAQEEIRQRVKELEEFYDMSIGREVKMQELKEELRILEDKLLTYEKKTEK